MPVLDVINEVLRLGAVEMDRDVGELYSTVSSFLEREHLSNLRSSHRCTN